MWSLGVCVFLILTRRLPFWVTSDEPEYTKVRTYARTHGMTLIGGNRLVLTWVRQSLSLTKVVAVFVCPAPLLFCYDNNNQVLKLAERIEQEEPHIPSYIPASMRATLEQLLHKHPRYRLTLRQAMRNEWISGAYCTCSTLVQPW